MLSYQSLMPAAAGTPRYENWRRWLVEAPAPPPLAGDKPQRYLARAEFSIIRTLSHNGLTTQSR